MKKFCLTIFLIIIISSSLIIADYYALFGEKLISKADFIELKFKTIDEEKGFKVTDVKIRCFKKGTNNACTQKESAKAGIVSVNIPVELEITRTFFFEKSIKPRIPEDPKIHIMFIHNDYAHIVETVFFEDLANLDDKIMEVPLPKSIRNQ